MNTSKGKTPSHAALATNKSPVAAKTPALPAKPLQQQASAPTARSGGKTLAPSSSAASLTPAAKKAAATLRVAKEPAPSLSQSAVLSSQAEPKKRGK